MAYKGNAAGNLTTFDIVIGPNIPLHEGFVPIMSKSIPSFAFIPHLI